VVLTSTLILSNISPYLLHSDSYFFYFLHRDFYRFHYFLHRYYLRFKDTYRQAAIDLTHGNAVSEDIVDGKMRVPEDDVREMFEKEENVKQLIEDCKKMLIVEPEECLGGWSLVNADPV